MTKQLEQIAEQYPELKRLKKVLNRSKGRFSLFFIECNLPSLRDELSQALASSLSEEPYLVDLSLFEMLLQQFSIDEVISQQIAQAESNAPIFLFGLEQLLPTLSSEKLHATVQQLNWRRSSLSRFQRPLLIWLPKYALDLLAEHTPDFYDWYSGVFVFNSSPDKHKDSANLAIAELWSENRVHAAERMTRKEKQQWMHTLKGLLQEHNRDNSDRSSLLVNLGYLMSSMGDNSQALELYQQALVIKREIGDKSGEGTTLNNISQIYDARGDYETALDYLKQSLAIQQEIGNKSGEGATLNNISQIFKARGDYETALDYLKQSLAILKDIGEKSGEGTTLNNISLIYSARGDYETALDYLKQSLAIRQEIGDKSGEGKTLNNLSQIYSARGDYETALDYLKQSLSIQQEIGDIAGLCATLFNIGHIHWQNEEQQDAMVAWGKVYGMAKKIELAQVLNALEEFAEHFNLPGGLDGWAAYEPEQKQE